MAKAKKLPSGNWRVRVYSHTDASGKKIYESFTASSKKEAELTAAQFAVKKNRSNKHDITVMEAIASYISAKDLVLSPSTIRSYRTMQRNSYGTINNIHIKKLTTEDLQRFVSELSTHVDAKSVKNAYSLLTASLRFVDPSFYFGRVNLPKKAKKHTASPSDDDVATLFDAASHRMKVCIALSAFGSLRLGEVCALKYGDITGRTVYVHADIVKGDNGWFYKDYPKTSDSNRSAILPEEVIDLIGNGSKDDYVTGYLPSGVSSNFSRLRERVGINVRFHDLRHYYASIGAVLNIPDIYLASFGGWRQNSPVMKEVYQNKITPLSEQYAMRMSDHFSSVIKKV